MSRRDDEVADTLPPEDRAASATDGPPVTNWDHYELLDLAGKGGMGAVYKARDRRLGRIVAIKFILGASPELAMRFVREAQALARIDHPNICRVYEAGQVEGRPYIALQFVNGEPLHKAAAQMSLDDKIAALRDVALAVHEAHQRGIVHRDLKPANVLVERTADGRRVPIVMDFGLAREATVETEITQSGVPVGTPAYMSPEQARGDVHAIDHRSDIYGLGATLYELLTGRAPFSAAAMVEALTQAIHDNPPAPRSLVPDLPVDLEIIVLKCLAKDPDQRYPSARALADDLDRYLHREPILGRRLALAQRLRLRARRNRALVIVGAGSLAIIVVVATLGILISLRERQLAEERARLAERLSREATEIERDLREAYLLPLHDTRADRERTRKRMQVIAATRHDLGELGEAIIHNALGRGHLALHEWQQASEQLAAAARANPQSELHAAMGRALGELYQRALEEVRHSVEKPGVGSQAETAWLARKEQELAQRYLTPALDHLAQSNVSGDDASLLQARIALYHRDFATVHQHALIVVDRAPGSSDARKLVADAAYGAAVQALDRGNYDAARADLARAAALYAQATEIARSDPSLYEAAAQTWLQRAEVDVRQDQSPREALERSLAAIDEGALRADPEDAKAYTIKAYALLAWYRAPTLATEDERSLLGRMVDAAASAVKLDRNVHTLTALGNAHVTRGGDEFYRGEASELWWKLAINEFHDALEIQRNDLRANNGMGTAHRWRGNSVEASGGDPTSEYQVALKSYETATRIDPQYLTACLNQIEAHTLIAEYKGTDGKDPRGDVDEAIAVGKRCRDIDENHFSGYEIVARAKLALANYLAEHGDPQEAIKAANDDLDQVMRLAPDHMAVWFHRGVAARINATYSVRRSKDPRSSVASGREMLDQALQHAPRAVWSHVEYARLGLIEALWIAHDRRAVVATLNTALYHAEQATKHNENLADAWLVRAEVCLQLARTNPSPMITKDGMDAARNAKRINKRLTNKAQAVLDALQQLPH